MASLSQSGPALLAYRSFHEMNVPWWLHLLWLTMVVWLIWRGYRRELADRRNNQACEDADDD
jgi:hypothetical protein